MEKFNIILPDLNTFYNISQIRMLHPEYFFNKIGQILVNHNFSYNIWSCTRQSFELNWHEDLEFHLNKIKDNGSSIVFNFENTKLENNHLKDSYSNLLLELAQSYNAYAIVYSEKLADYIKQKFQEIKLISSAFCKKDNFEYPFDFYALEYDSYKKKENKIKDKSKVVLYTNSFCKNAYTCKDNISNKILNFEIQTDNVCPNIIATFNESMKEPAFISNKEILQKANEGIKLFIIKAPENTNTFELINASVYYLIKPKYRDLVRLDLIKLFMSDKIKSLR